MNGYVLNTVHDLVFFEYPIFYLLFGRNMENAVN